MEQLVKLDETADEALFQCAGFRIDTTGNCNLRCPYCANDFSGIHGNLMMTPEVFAKVVPLFPLLGPKGDLLLSCFFEPTLNPGFLDLVDTIPAPFRKRAGFTTNLAKPLEESFFERLAVSGLGFVNVSIDSLDPSVFMEMRRNARFEVFIENLGNLVRAFRQVTDSPQLHLITVVSRLNLAEIPDFVSRCGERFHPFRHGVRPIWMNEEISSRDWVTRNSLTLGEFIELRGRLKASETHVDIAYDLPRSEESFSPFPARLDSQYLSLLDRIPEPTLARMYTPPLDPILRITSSGILRFLIADPEFSIDLRRLEDPYSVVRQCVFLQNLNVSRARLLRSQTEAAAELEQLLTLNRRLEQRTLQLDDQPDASCGYLDAILQSPREQTGSQLPGYTASGWACRPERGGPAEAVLVVARTPGGQPRAVGIDVPDRERLDVVEHFSDPGLLYSGWSARLHLSAIAEHLPGRITLEAYALDDRSSLGRHIGGACHVDLG